MLKDTSDIFIYIYIILGVLFFNHPENPKDTCSVRSTCLTLKGQEATVGATYLSIHVLFGSSDDLIQIRIYSAAV